MCKFIQSCGAVLRSNWFIFIFIFFHMIILVIKPCNLRLEAACTGSGFEHLMKTGFQILSRSKWWLWCIDLKTRLLKCWTIKWCRLLFNLRVTNRVCPRAWVRIYWWKDRFLLWLVYNESHVIILSWVI